MMKVTLSCYTPDPVLAIARAVKTCYSDGDYEAVNNQLIDVSKREKMIKNIIDSGHGSCLEHAVFTFFIEGVSRACTHQLVRHRMASYEQRSQRYTSQRYNEYYIPESIKCEEKAKHKYLGMLSDIHDCYNELVDMGIPKEDARYILPNASTSTIVVTMNLRSLRNFWELRMCNRAQFEIQRLAVEMYKLVENIDPILVYKAGPKCMTGVGCNEKKKTPRCPFDFDDVKTEDEINLWWDSLTYEDWIRGEYPADDDPPPDDDDDEDDSNE